MSVVSAPTGGSNVTNHEVIKLTRAATRHLNRGDLRNAISTFRYAARVARQNGDPLVIRTSVFNLGACLVAVGRSADGLRELDKAMALPGVTPSRKGDLSGACFLGDLYYNQYMAHHQLGHHEEMIRCLTNAHREYLPGSNNTSLGNPRLAAETAMKLAEIYEADAFPHSPINIVPNFEHSTPTNQTNHTSPEETLSPYPIYTATVVAYNESSLEKAIDYLTGAAELLRDCTPSLGQNLGRGDLGDLLDIQVHAIIRLASCECKVGRREKALEKLEEAANLIGSFDQSERKGSLLNEMALVYMQCSEFEKALAAFKSALMLVTNDEGKAYINQNIGATHNALNQYQDAIFFHKEAVRIHGGLNNRSSEAQCFANLGYAYSQVELWQEAEDAFRHAIQLCKDVGPCCTALEQACMEWLGDVHYHENRIDESVQEFQNALAMPGDGSAVRRDRLVKKLTVSLTRLEAKNVAIHRLKTKSSDISEASDVSSDSEDIFGETVEISDECESERPIVPDERQDGLQRPQVRRFDSAQTPIRPSLLKSASFESDTAMLSPRPKKSVGFMQSLSGKLPLSQNDDDDSVKANKATMRRVAREQRFSVTIQNNRSLGIVDDEEEDELKEMKNNRKSKDNGGLEDQGTKNAPDHIDRSKAMFRLQQFSSKQRIEEESEGDDSSGDEEDQEASVVKTDEDDGYEADPETQQKVPKKSKELIKTERQLQELVNRFNKGADETNTEEMKASTSSSPLKNGDWRDGDESMQMTRAQRERELYEDHLKMKNLQQQKPSDEPPKDSKDKSKACSIM